VYGTSLILLFACSARFIPFTTRVAVASMKQVHPSMIEAARLCSGNLAKTVGGITGPLCVPGIAASLYLGYVLCLGELGTTLLVIPPGASTITIRIYTLLHYGAGREVAALCLVLIGLAFLPFPFIALWIKKYAAAEQRY
jgi:iron(III) transport system permease protein